jgi:GMP reductase
MKINNEIQLDFDDVLIEPQRSTVDSRADIEILREFKFYHSPRTWKGTPVMCANMGFCSFPIADKMADNNMIAVLHKYHSVEELVQYFKQKPQNIPYVWISIGYKKSELSKLIELDNQLLALDIESPNICIDVPNGHMDSFVKYCKEVRSHFEDSIIMAGNVTNTASTQELIIHGGVDIVKVGIGGGSACLSRFVTGCGFPQLSCVINNGYIAHGQQKEPKKIGLVCSDGGHKNSGDIAKALCAGADFICLGGYFSGVDECVGEWTYDYCSIDPKKIPQKINFTYYGMSTHYAQAIYEDTKKDYRASEGTKITVPYKGPIQNIINELLGGIRSCCSYIGAVCIKDMNKCASFIRVTKIHDNKNPQYLI